MLENENLNTIKDETTIAAQDLLNNGSIPPLLNTPNKITLSDLISPARFNNFTYSKKSHFGFFKQNNYDIELYGKRIQSEDCDVRVYQNLLVYAFIINNIKKGAKILEIGGEYSPLFERLKNEYDFWTISNSMDLSKEVNSIEKDSSSLLKDNNNTYHKNLPRSFFDFVFSVSAFEKLPEEEFLFRNILSNINYALKPFGFTLNCFVNVEKAGHIWSNKLLYFLFDNADAVNKLTKNYKILKDPDLFVISEKFFETTWKDDSNMSYEEFGKPFSTNILWQKKEFIDASGFQNFTYSKKSHFDFFNKVGCSENVFFKELTTAEYSISNFQELLMYSYITNNIPKGSTILRLGSGGSILMHLLKDEYEFFTLEDTERLSKRIICSVDPDSLFVKDNNGELINFFPIQFFDFIYSLSALDEYEERFWVFSNILYNLELMLKPFSYILMSFDSIFYNRAAQSNFFLYFLLNNIDSANKFVKPAVMFEDDDLYFVNESNFFLNDRIKSANVSRVCCNILWKSTPLLSIISGSRPTDTLMKSHAYIFHHIMKCGGTSVVVTLDNWFNVVFDHTEDPNGLYKNLNDYYKYKYNLENFSSDTCLVAHFQYDGFFLQQRYPESIKRPDEFKIFTFIRDPLQLMISLYYYGRKRIFRSLENYLMGDRNFLSKRFPCGEDNYKEVLDRYFFIGLVEKMQESFDKLADLTSKRRINLPVINKSEKDDQSSMLPVEFIEKFKNWNKLDYMIYEYCLEKFEKLR